MKLGSLFDGIGGWPLAATKFGIEPVWCSEIEKFPQEITKRHFPNMKHLGDITKIDGAKIEPVDIVTIGSPCQDLSIAGKRKGLAGERSGLFRTAIYIVRGMRNSTDGEYPRFVVWENVPGAFSSNKGHDFQSVLEEITESDIPMPKSGKWAHAGMVRGNNREVAWRVLDAQHWGVPQRRKRIFLVADFAGDRAAEILFKPESVPGDFEKVRSKRESTAGRIEDSLRATVVRMRGGCEGGGKGALVSVEKSLTLAANTNDQTLFQPIIWDMTHADEVMRPVKDGIVPTLNARMGTGGNQVPVVQEPVYCIQGNTIDRNSKQNGSGICKEVAHTLTSTDMHGVAYGIQGSMIGRTDKTGPQGNGINEDVSFTLNTIDHHAVAYCVGNGQLGQAKLSEKVGALNCMYDQQAIPINYTVRRLTPTECERLQGLPDGYTLIDDKKCSDSARYKALGNGMAQPCPDFVIQGIAEVLAIDGDKGECQQQ